MHNASNQQKGVLDLKVCTHNTNLQACRKINPKNLSICNRLLQQMFINRIVHHMTWEIRETTKSETKTIIPSSDV